ncbi:MAG: DUF2309 domain-containing protein, partial [Planctomycetaceae bacterium]|nr:DUF2309 domain-containing protein [Planctomycetaceae bacterium]
MHAAGLASPPAVLHSPHDTRAERLEEAIAHAAHLLPMQRPITVFVHHNTLHAFENLPFHRGVAEAAEIFGCQPYLAEEQYRRYCADGRITQADLTAVLLEFLADDGDQLIGFMGTRHHLRLAMLEHPLPQGSDAELRWCIAETEALFRYRPEAPLRARQHAMDETRRWLLRHEWETEASASTELANVVQGLGEQFKIAEAEAWTDEAWEAFTLHLLWSVCERGVAAAPIAHEVPPLRHSDLLKAVAHVNSDDLVHPFLIRFSAAFLDQGFAHWSLPGRQAGFLAAFVGLYRESRPVEPWLQALPEELQRIAHGDLDSTELITESLIELGVAPEEYEEFLTQSLQALRGWGGMVQQMETNASWCPFPAPAGALRDFIAVRLLLDRLALMYAAKQTGFRMSLARLRAHLRRSVVPPACTSAVCRAFTLFQLAQVRGWTPRDLFRQSQSEWRRLVAEVDAFSNIERRRVFHGAYERRFWNRSLDALAAHAVARQLERTEATQRNGSSHTPAYQVVCCIDEREESYRRHLEEVDPECQTFGVAGFFGVAMYYRGATEAHYRPLCPIVVTPTHYVTEEPVLSREEASRLQAETRRVIGRAVHGVHLGSRTMLGGLLMTFAGSLATMPMLARILFPRITTRVREQVRQFVIPRQTMLRLERSAAAPGPTDDALGYKLEEMANIVQGTLRAIGLTREFSPLVIITGHGSGSLNNPHASAYDCGACGGGRGGPNARAFAQMANDPRVRSLLYERGLLIPDGVAFIGAIHNTCDDSVTFSDVDRVPATHRALFERARRSIDAARRRNAHERCRRFVSAPLTLSFDAALRHVENRAADLSQTRPELGHATNALCLVGRREWSRGLFFDRRAFLTSYDSRQDDEKSSTLAGILRPVIPVCAGISLEYLFSRVDSRGYGCGTKLPHNVTSMLGVMDGAASDLRTGLPWQMVEIHEPVRIMFVIETTPAAMLRLIENEPDFRLLVQNDWVHVAVFDPDSGDLQIYRQGRFEPYSPDNGELPTAPSSLQWYRGQRDHLGFAAI